jgi:thiosulfate reductase / polysulfide reductase chain A
MSKEVSRREFLKISSGTAAALGVSFTPGTLGALGTKAIQGSDKFVRSYCEMCSSRCPIEGRVVDGKNVFIQGNAYAKSMGSSVCARGASGHSQLYDNERLVTPLMRVGARGEGKFKEVSWDEAFSFIAKKMNEIKDKYGPQSMIFSSKTGEQHGQCMTLSRAYGSPNIFSHVSSCPVSGEIAMEHTVGTGKMKRDFSHAKYVLNFGHNLFEGINVATTKKMAKTAASEKTKLVVVEPRFSIISSKADEWHPIKPGTDLAFVLSLIHIWLRDGKYDKKFVEEYTVGIQELKNATMQTTPKWQEAYTGISADVAEKIADEVFQAAPRCIIDWGHKTTTGFAEYQKSRAIIIANMLMGNVEKEGGIFFAKKAKTVNKLARMQIAPELTNPNGNIKAIKTPRIDGAGEKGENIFVARKHGSLTDIAEAILSEKPYEVKGWFLIRHNPILTVSNIEKTKKAMQKLDLVVACDVYLSDTAMYADVILPEATYLERDEGIQDKSSLAPAYMMRNKIVEPINNTLSNSEIFRRLAKELHIDSQYSWNTIGEFRTIQAKGNFDLLKTLITKGYATFDIPPLLLREKKYVKGFIHKYPNAASHLNVKGEFDLGPFKTHSGKIQLFSQEVEDNFPGYGVPSMHSLDVAHPKYPYILTSGKTAIHTNGHTQNVPFLNMLMSDNPIWIHPKTAQKAGVKNGEKIYLQNETAREKATVFITEGISPNVLFGYMGFGRNSTRLSRTSGKGTNMSRLLPDVKAPVCSTMITNVGVEIIKA